MRGWNVRFRYSFLRDHVPELLGRVDDVLAVRDLWWKLKGPWRAVFRCQQGREPKPGEMAGFQRELLQDFFYGQPNIVSYLPIELRSPDRPGTFFRELSELVIKTDGEPRPGVLLVARSGAGKTTKMAKLAWDCLLAGESDPLAAFLPVRLPVERAPQWVWDLEAEFRRRSGGKSKARSRGEASGQYVARHLVNVLLADAAGPTGVRPISGPPSVQTRESWSERLAGQALEHGPRLLVLVDLNAVSDVHTQGLLAKSLAHWQERWKRRSAGGPGHRCVVAYRSGAEEDAARKQLASTFERYDLAPLTPDDAVSYPKTTAKRRRELKSIRKLLL